MMGGGGGSIDGRPHRPVARGPTARILPLSKSHSKILYYPSFVVRVALRAVQEDVHFIAF